MWTFTYLMRKQQKIKIRLKIGLFMAMFLNLLTTSVDPKLRTTSLEDCFSSRCGYLKITLNEGNSDNDNNNYYKWINCLNNWTSYQRNWIFFPSFSCRFLWHWHDHRYRLCPPQNYWGRGLHYSNSLFSSEVVHHGGHGQTLRLSGTGERK